MSISLRNLSLQPSPSSRARGKTIDDDAVPNTLKSPAKLVTLREQKALGYSRSSSDLRTVAENAVAESDGESLAGSPHNTPTKAAAPTPTPKANGSPAARAPLQRPSARLRRRSTLEWINATPQRRQEKLQDVTAERMADVFFSLHVRGVEGMVRCLLG